MAKFSSTQRSIEHLQECVSSQIPKLIAEHPKWEMDKVVVVAYKMCRLRAAINEGTAAVESPAKDNDTAP